jgi:hypothetical protein
MDNCPESSMFENLKLEGGWLGDLGAVLQLSPARGYAGLFSPAFRSLSGDHSPALNRTLLGAGGILHAPSRRTQAPRQDTLSS